MMNLNKLKRDMTKGVREKGLIAPAFGVFTGLFGANFLSETAARATGKTGYVKAGIKSLMKVILAVLAFGTSMGMPGTAIVMYPATLGILSSIPFDWLEAKFPGGINGMAERAAVVVRTWSVGVEEVQQQIEQMSKISKTTPKTEPKTDSELVKNHKPPEAQEPSQPPSYLRKA